jgi:hypothetical protein
MQFVGMLEYVRVGSFFTCRRKTYNFGSMGLKSIPTTAAMGFSSAGIVQHGFVPW